MEFSPAIVERYLSHRFGSKVTVEKLERFSRGSSRQTWFIDVAGDIGAEDRELVLRCDLAGGSTDPTSLEQEHFIYERLGHTDVPVAKVLFWEDDPAWTDMPFYIRRKVDGSWNIPNFLDPDPKYDPFRIEISKEHLRCLARVHNVDWRRLGFGERLPVPPDEASCARVYVDTILAQFDEIRSEGIPLMLETGEWLKKHAPAADRISLCKGTNGFGEEVFRDGKVVAMSDWEEVSIGDPAADFAFMQYLIPELVRDGRQVWGLEQALDYYRSVSGINVTAEAVQFYRVLRGFRLLMMSHKAAEAVHANPAKGEIRQTWTGTEVSYVCKRGLLAAMGLSEPPPAQVVTIEMHASVESTQ
jgi:aminoglycoside phosphotransferase (APT) family kinase protein